jgi:hypothetical protein
VSDRVERELRRLGVIVRVLAALLLAIAVRAVTGGLTTAAGLSAVVVMILLVAAAALSRYGRRLSARPVRDEGPEKATNRL